MLRSFAIALAGAAMSSMLLAVPAVAARPAQEAVQPAAQPAAVAPMERAVLEQSIARALADDLPAWGAIAKLPPETISTLAARLMPLSVARDPARTRDDALDQAVNQLVKSSTRHPLRSWLLGQTTRALDPLKKRYGSYTSYEDLVAGPIGLVGLSMAAETDWIEDRQRGGRPVPDWEAMQDKKSRLFSDYVTSVMKLPVAQGEGVQAIAEILDSVPVESRSDDPMIQLAGHERAARIYAESPGADPWLAQTWRGSVYLRAAQSARGTGTFDSVSAKQIKRMNAYLAKAAEHLKAAHQIAPHRPLPATSMMLVALYAGDESFGTVRSWYDLAAPVAPGDTRPIDQLINASMPRWGGTPRQMREVIALAASSTRYDTILPYYAFIAAQTLRRDISNGGSPFASADVAANVRKALLPYLTAPAPGVDLSKVRTALVLVARGQNDPAAAAEQFKVAGWSPQPRSDVWGVTGQELEDWAAIASSPVAKTVESSDAHLRAGRLSEALAAADEAAKSPQVVAGSPTARAIARRQAIINATLDLNAGKSIELIKPGSPGTLWRVADNTDCVAEDDGAMLLSRPRANAWVDLARPARLMCQVPVGTRFEVKLRVRFPDQDKSGQAMLALHYGDRAEQNMRDPEWLPSLLLRSSEVSFGGIGEGFGGPVGGAKSRPRLTIDPADPNAPMQVTFKFDTRRGRAWDGHGPETPKAISFSDSDVGADRGAAGQFLSFSGVAGPPLESGPIRIESVLIRKLRADESLPAPAPTKQPQPKIKLPSKIGT